MKQVLIGLALVGSLTGCARTIVESPGDGSDLGMTVTGVGRVDAKPDTLVVDLRIQRFGSSATGALAETSRIARSVLAALEDADVPPGDIRTLSFNLNAERRYDPSLRRSVTTGRHSASERLTVKLRNVEAAGDILARVVAAGEDALSIAHISLEVDDPDAVRDEARAEAIADARERAEALAREGGLTLGAALSVAEVEEPSYFGRAETSLALSGGIPAPAAIDLLSSAPQIETGTQELTVRVRVRFALD